MAMDALQRRRILVGLATLGTLFTASTAAVYQIGNRFAGAGIGPQAFSGVPAGEGASTDLKPAPQPLRPIAISSDEPTETGPTDPFRAVGSSRAFSPVEVPPTRAMQANFESPVATDAGAPTDVAPVQPSPADMVSPADASGGAFNASPPPVVNASELPVAPAPLPPGPETAPVVSAPPVAEPAPFGANTLRNQTVVGDGQGANVPRSPEVVETPEAYVPRPPARLGVPEQVARSSVGDATERSTGTSGEGKPGPRNMEGPQTPSLVLEKFAPAEIQVGKPATFQVKVRNLGQATAEQVVVRDNVPSGTRLLDTTPAATRSPDGALAWNLGSLPAGGEATVAMQVLPEMEGEIGSVATVDFRAQVSARTMSTRPQIVIEHAAPERVLIGETAKISVKIMNRGTGAAADLTVEEDVPVGLSHAAGRELEYEIGTLRPGEERQFDLMLKAEQAGPVENILVVRSEGSLMAEDRARLEVIAPQLQVAIAGPKLRYLERAATYNVTVSNPGTAPAREVELITHLPKGMKFVSANQQGQYDPQVHAVFWSLAELPAQQMGQVELTALPIEAGEHKLRVAGKAHLGLESQQEQMVSVEGLAALLFEVTDLADPIEVGKDTVYQIKVMNQGSKQASNIQVTAVLPAEMKPIAGEGPTKVSVDGQRALFEALPRLAPGENALYKLQVRGLRSGDLRMRVQVTSDDLQTPVTKEESTRVYSDQ